MLFFDRIIGTVTIQSVFYIEYVTVLRYNICFTINSKPYRRRTKKWTEFISRPAAIARPLAGRPQSHNKTGTASIKKVYYGVVLSGASWSGTWTGRGCRAGSGGRGCGRAPPGRAAPRGPAGRCPRRTARASPRPSAPATHPPHTPARSVPARLVPLALGAHSPSGSDFKRKTWAYTLHC